MEYNIVDNKERSRFEVLLNGEYAFVDYRWRKGDLAIMHTEVPKEYEGKGIAAAMVKHVLEYAKKEGLKIKRSFLLIITLLTGFSMNTR